MMHKSPVSWKAVHQGRWMAKCMVAVCAAMLLAACGGNARTAEPAHYDLGNPGAAAAGWTVAPAIIEVQAAAWLTGPAMHYRPAYAEPLRRQAYAGSRWAASPAELLEGALRRRAAAAEATAQGAGCRLQLALDEFEQRFDDPRSSQSSIEVRAQLLPLQGGDSLARRAFRVARPAPTPDAGGGAMAARDAVQGLGDDLGRWLADLARERPGMLAHCRN